MKYEYLKGSEKDFEGAPEFFNIAVKTPDGNVKYCHELCMVLPPIEVIAERRQITEPSWDGVGMPPVGCECEVLYDTGRDEWFLAKIIGHDNGSVVGRWLNGDGLYSLFYYSHTSCSFRPIRTEADKKRDAAIKALDNWLPEYTTDIPSLDGAIAIYDAIAAGKIPGVKLED